MAAESKNGAAVAYEVSTSIFPDGRIEQRVEFVFDQMRQQLERSVVSTKDKQMRDALQQLGWTPPPWEIT